MKTHAYNPRGPERGRVGGLGYSVRLLCLNKRRKEGGQERMQSKRLSERMNAWLQQSSRGPDRVL